MTPSAPGFVVSAAISSAFRHFRASPSATPTAMPEPPPTPSAVASACRSGASAFVSGNLLTLTAGGADGGIGAPASAFLTTGTTIVFTATGTGNVDLAESDSAFISGVSGAGKKAEEAYLFCERAESAKAYGLVKHRHLAEVEEQLALHTGEPRYREAYQVYHSRDFARAYDMFTKLEESYPDDKLVQVYKGRCEYFLKTPPAASWDGVYERRSK